MASLKATTGYSRNGLPYARFGFGSRSLIMLSGGPDFRHEPPSAINMRWVAGAYGLFASDYTVYYVTRKQGLPTGYSFGDMARDYAVMIRDELGGSADVIGISTGGMIAQHLAADQPDVVRRLTLVCSAYRLGDEAQRLSMRISKLAVKGRWRSISATIMGGIFARGVKHYLFRIVGWLLPPPILRPTGGPSDGLIELEAERSHNFKDRLSEIQAPTLVVCGDDDFFFPIQLVRETAAGIPNARLIVYEGVGHEAPGTRRVAQDAFEFIVDEAD